MKIYSLYNVDYRPPTVIKMNTKNILLIFILVSGTLFIIGSIVLSESTDNPPKSIASILDQTPLNQITLDNQNELRVDQNSSNTNNNQSNRTALSPDDPGVKAEFDRIAATPYDAANYNCLNKSRDFQNYLLQHGANNTYVVRIKHNSGSYMHMFVVWNGRAYDPTNKPPYYGVDYNKYIAALNEQGFTTVISQR